MYYLRLYVVLHGGGAIGGYQPVPPPLSHPHTSHIQYLLYGALVTTLEAHHH